MGSVVRPNSAAMANALGVIAQPGLTVTASLVRALAARSLLLIVDNCEHVLDAVATVLDAVLTQTRTVKVLATSREGLRVRAEHLRPTSADASTASLWPSSSLLRSWSR